MTNTIESVAAACLGAVMKDEPWIDFGYTKRPPFLVEREYILSKT